MHFAVESTEAIVTMYCDAIHRMRQKSTPHHQAATMELRDLWQPDDSDKQPKSDDLVQLHERHADAEYPLKLAELEQPEDSDEQSDSDELVHLHERHGDAEDPLKLAELE